MDFAALLVFYMPVGVVAVAFEAECELVVGVALGVVVGCFVFAEHEAVGDRAFAHVLVGSHASVPAFHLDI